APLRDQRLGGLLEVQQLRAGVLHRRGQRLRILQPGQRDQRGGVAFAAHQQATDRQFQRRAGQVVHGQRRRLAGGGHVLEEGLEGVGQERRILQRLFQRGAQGVRVGQLRLARALQGGARQVARGQ